MNRKEEIKRLPFVVSAYKQIYRSESCCGICNLPWSVCGHEHIDITDKYGVFYVCPYCWENNDLQTILKATTQGYLSQFHIHALQMKIRRIFLKNISWLIY